MRKISKTRHLDHDTSDAYLADTRQRGISGATITSKPAPDIDLEAFFARPGSDATVTGAAPAPAGRFEGRAEGTVSLSDGTRITFATAAQFDIVELV